MPDDTHTDAERHEVQWKDVCPGDIVKLGHKHSIGELWFVVRTIGRFQNKVYLSVDGLWTDVIQQCANDYVLIGPRGGEV